jgi:hypothetical protein
MKGSMRTQDLIGFRRRVAIALGALVALGMIDAALPLTPRSAEDMQSARFRILAEFQDEAVLDQETQLIWERTPSSTGTAWVTASTHCALKSTGGRRGWRLPSFLELMTLVQPSAHSVAAMPTLPVDHLFRGVKASAYWTSTPLPDDPQRAYAVDFQAGDLAPHRKTQSHFSWCVQGGIASVPVHPPVGPHPESVWTGPNLG